MSTESGKTCGCKVHEHSSQCFQIAGDGYFCPTAESDEVKIEYCPLHDGSMTEKLAEALRAIAELDPETDSTEGFNEWGEAECFNKSQALATTALAAYDELQGRKG